MGRDTARLALHTLASCSNREMDLVRELYRSNACVRHISMRTCVPEHSLQASQMVVTLNQQWDESKHSWTCKRASLPSPSPFLQLLPDLVH